jgi:hypothetical protein
MPTINLFCAGGTVNGNFVVSINNPFRTPGDRMVAVGTIDA